MIRSGFVLVTLMALLLAGCMQEQGLTYRVAYDATPDERLAIAEAFEAWVQSTGVGAREVAQPGKATITILLGEPPDNKLGYAHYRYDVVFNTNTLSQQKVLTDATITTSPRARDLDHAAQVRYYNHEIGHIMTRSDHSQVCPSTMNAFPQTCGTEQVDQSAASVARTNLRAGWLQKAIQILP